MQARPLLLRLATLPLVERSLLPAPNARHPLPAYTGLAPNPLPTVLARVVIAERMQWSPAGMGHRWAQLLEAKWGRANAMQLRGSVPCWALWRRGEPCQSRANGGPWART